MFSQKKYPLSLISIICLTILTSMILITDTNATLAAPEAPSIEICTEEFDFKGFESQYGVKLAQDLTCQDLEWAQEAIIEYANFLGGGDAFIKNIELKSLRYINNNDAVEVKNCTDNVCAYTTNKEIVLDPKYASNVLELTLELFQGVYQGEQVTSLLTSNEIAFKFTMAHELTHMFQSSPMGVEAYIQTNLLGPDDSYPFLADGTPRDDANPFWLRNKDRNRWKAEGDKHQETLADEVAAMIYFPELDNYTSECSGWVTRFMIGSN